MQSVREHVPEIDSVLVENVSAPYDGITLTETSFLCRKSLNRMFVIEVDLNKGYSFRPSTPDNGSVSGKMQNMLLQAEVAQKAGADVLYAINGDVFGGYRDDLPGKNVPSGVVYIDGEALQSYHHRTAENVFYVRDDGTVEIARYPQFEAESGRIRHAIGAWHTLVWDGKPAEAPDDFLGKGTHPRTFLGISRDRDRVWVFVVDGRQPELSEGLMMEDMISICTAAGCDRAVNFDGGGSTTLVACDASGFYIMNSPSDEGHEPRPVVDGLLITKE